ncbi:MAG: rRNA maturation RNase YbeY [Methylococcaceae bacterium]|jgi:probable rRNA maturation factor
MNYLDIQTLIALDGQPNTKQMQLWVDAALVGYAKDAEIVIRIVDEIESAQLNQEYRHKSGATNILSFPFELPPGMNSLDVGGLQEVLGDLVICSPILVKEAQEQGKSLQDHWAHIIIHGVLHLLGYDHVEDNEAEVMEAMEIAILKTLNIGNPYNEASL